MNAANEKMAVHLRGGTYRAACDWPMGDYECHCVTCGGHYIGPKRTACCNVCAASPTTAASPQVRMLTHSEVVRTLIKVEANLALEADAIQRKFCEVNGLSLRASGATEGQPSTGMGEGA